MNIDHEKLRELASNPNRALEIGKAAEHLVCANLILSGHRCYLSDQGLPYDVVADVDGRLIRIQVKASCFQSGQRGYIFNARRRGKGGSKRLTDADGDIVALVALDIGIVAYLPVFEIGQTCELRPPGHEFKGRYVRVRPFTIDQLPFARALERLTAGAGGLQTSGEAIHREFSLFEIDGERRTLNDWATISGVQARIISTRMGRGWPLKDAVFRPISATWSRQRGATNGR